MQKAEASVVKCFYSQISLWVGIEDWQGCRLKGCIDPKLDPDLSPYDCEEPASLTLVSSIKWESNKLSHRTVRNKVAKWEEFNTMSFLVS